MPRAVTAKPKQPRISTSVINLRIPAEFREAVDAFADEHRVPHRSELVRLALASYIGRPELADVSREAS